MIETILLDLDDTILDFHKAEALALSGTLQQLGITPTAERIALYSRINAAQWRRLEAGEITRPEVLTTRFRIFFREIGEERSCEKTQSIYESLLSEGHFFIDGAVEVLDVLHKQYALYLVSNGNLRVQEGRLKSAEISHYFRNIFISEQIGADKPSRTYFERCFAQISNFNRDTALIVGDSLTSDVQGGINAGIRTCWFNPNGKPSIAGIRPDYEIRDLRELISLAGSV